MSQAGSEFQACMVVRGEAVLEVEAVRSESDGTFGRLAQISVPQLY